MRGMTLLILVLACAGCGQSVSNRVTVAKRDQGRPALVVGHVEHKLFGLYEGDEHNAPARQLLSPVHDVLEVIGGWAYVHRPGAATLERHRVAPAGTGWRVGPAEALPYTHLGEAVRWLNHTSVDLPPVDAPLRRFLVHGGGISRRDVCDWRQAGEAALIAGDDLLPLGQLAEQPVSLHGRQWVVVAGQPGQPRSVRVLDDQGGMIAGPFPALRVIDTSPKSRPPLGDHTKLVQVQIGEAWWPITGEGRPYDETGLVSMRPYILEASWADQGSQVKGWLLSYHSDGVGDRFGFASGELRHSTGPVWLAADEETISYRAPSTYELHTRATLLLRTTDGWTPFLLPSHADEMERVELKPLAVDPLADRAAAAAAAKAAYEDRAERLLTDRRQAEAKAWEPFEAAIARGDRAAAMEAKRGLGNAAHVRFHVVFGGTAEDLRWATEHTSDPAQLAALAKQRENLEHKAAAKREADRQTRAQEEARWREQRVADLRAEAARAQAEFDAQWDPGSPGNGGGNFDITKADPLYFSRRAVLREAKEAVEKSPGGLVKAREDFVRRKMGEARYREWRALPAAPLKP